ncbi:MAG: polysaccharide biosynthesis C-terminal domain-containing protein, partial [Methanobrevibacter sp.]|nr:polysaccharide biosynthesis C-terminal domain-containing protein [Methanobrevibacter sp.]
LYAENTNLLKLSFEQSIKYSLLILLPISIGVYIYSPTIIDLIYGSEYALASTSMQILIWTIIFLFINGVTSSLLNAIDKEIDVTKIYIVVAFVNIVLNYFAIIIWSYNGAALTTVLCEILVLYLMLLKISKTEYKADISLWKSVIKLVICGAILSIVLYLINVSLWLAIPIGLIVFVASLFLTKSIDDTDKYIVKELLKK